MSHSFAPTMSPGPATGLCGSAAVLHSEPRLPEFKMPQKHATTVDPEPHSPKTDAGPLLPRPALVPTARAPDARAHTESWRHSLQLALLRLSGGSCSSRAFTFCMAAMRGPAIGTTCGQEEKLEGFTGPQDAFLTKTENEKNFGTPRSQLSTQARKWTALEGQPTAVAG